MSVLALIIAQAVTAAPPGPCVVFPMPAVEGRAQTLMAGCGSQGIILGPTDTYQVFTNQAERTTLVDLTFNGDRRILMLSYPGDRPLLEDISGTLALAAGRGPMSSLRDVEIDLSGFAADGTVAVSTPGGQSMGQSTAEVDLGQSVAVEAARLEAPATNTAAQ